MMICLSYRLPTAALLHIGPMAKPRFLGLATGPICWVPPTHPKQMRSAISLLSFSYYYISLYWLNTLILTFSHLTLSVNALLICVYSLLLSYVNSEPNLLIRPSNSYPSLTHLSFGPYFLIFISLPPIY